MAKTLKNGLSMIETNPLNHNWSDFAIQSGWALHQFKKNAVKQQLHQKQFPPIVQGKLCQKLAAIIIFIVSCGQNQEPKKFSHRRSCKWHLYCLLRLESELYSNVVCGAKKLRIYLQYRRLSIVKTNAFNQGPALTRAILLSCLKCWPETSPNHMA